MVRRLVVIAVGALAVAPSAAGELVARAPDGMLAVSPRGTPFVGYVQGSRFVVVERRGPNRWRQQAVATVTKGSTIEAFSAGAAGPAAAIVSPDDRTIFVVRRQANKWIKTRLGGRLDPDVVLGWPGLALDRGGRPVVAFTRWNTSTLLSQLILARLNASGAVHLQRITAGGWPKSEVAPPATPVVLPNGAVHVLQSYGIGGTVGTFEWMPTKGTWVGLNLSVGRAWVPVGPIFAAPGRGGVLYAAWTEAFPDILYPGFPVTLATRGREIKNAILSQRAATAGLVMTPFGPEVAANEWVSPTGGALDFPGADTVWAATLTGRAGSELDGRLAGVAAVPGSAARDLLLAKGSALSWFRARGSLPVHVSLRATERDNGGVTLSGRVRGARGGKVTVYRERSAGHRDEVGAAEVRGAGSFALVDSRRTGPTIYRAVYTDPQTGIPYAKLLREPVG